MRTLLQKMVRNAYPTSKVSHLKWIPLCSKEGHQERGQRAGAENVSAIVGLDKAAELVTACAQFFVNGGDRYPEGSFFGSRVLGLAIWYRLQSSQRIEQRDSADGHSRRSLNALDKRILPHFSAQQPADIAEGHGVIDDLGELGRQCDEKRYRLVIERARRLPLSHQDSHHPAIGK